MTTSELVLAIIGMVGIFVALAIGVASIKKTERIQKSEKNQRLVKDIEEWAQNVIEFLTEYQKYVPAQDFFWEWQGRWLILKDTKTDIEEAASNIDKGFGQKVSKAVTDFNAMDNTADEQKRTRTNIANELERCKNSCREVLRSAGSLKFKEIG